MTRETFILRLKQSVFESSIDAVIGLLHNPPGNRPPTALADLSQWFNQQSPEDRVRLEKAIRLAVRQAVFSMLAVLDGVRTLNDTGERGTLELRYNSGDRSMLLNDHKGDYLHDLFAEQVPVD